MCVDVVSYVSYNSKIRSLGGLISLLLNAKWRTNETTIDNRLGFNFPTRM